MAYQFLRGDKAENDAYTGPSGSITVDFEEEVIRVHDGVTAGGAFSVALNTLQATYGSTSITLEDALASNVSLSAATTSAAGVMTSADKTKLNGIETGAQTNRSIATDPQAIAGTNNTAIMTPQKSTLLVDNYQYGGRDWTDYLRSIGLGTDFTYRITEETYWFFSYLTSNTTTGAGRNPIVFDAIRGGSRGYNQSTGAFTAPAAGVYFFSAKVLRNDGFNNGGVNIFITRNGATSGPDAVGSFSSTAGFAKDNGFLEASAVAIMTLNQGDTVDVRQEANIEIAGDTSELRTVFQGYLI